jgi:hypothetical protein
MGFFPQCVKLNMNVRHLISNEIKLQYYKLIIRLINTKIKIN